ncbi:MAG TPA: DNA gyrase modulator, partial [Woeseiaceae bacterium]|nr:DNA gyrase modulator [Woeseiaceae bacterium]
MRPDEGARAADAVQMALDGGADDAFVSEIESRDVELSYRDGALEEVKDATSRNMAVELYVDGRYSTHRTTDLEPDRLRDFIREAVALTRALEADPFRRITPPALFAGRPEIDLDLVDAAVGRLNRERRLEWCAALDGAARSHEHVLSATAGIYDGTVESSAAGSNGFRGRHASTYCWLGSAVTLKDRGDRRAG